MLVHTLLQDMARQAPDKAALIAAGLSHSFRDIDLASDRMARALQWLGVGRGDRVAAMLENCAELVIAFWAALKAGAVFVPLPPATKAEKLAFILDNAEACCLIAPAALRSRVAEARARAPSLRTVIWSGPGAETQGQGDMSLAEILARPQEAPRDPRLIDEDLCLILYTSGTTGQPKGVMMTHRAIRNNARAIAAYLGNGPQDVVMCVLPICFNYGLSQVLAGACAGYTLVLERSFAFPYDVLKRMAEHRVTGFPGVPTIFAALLQFAPFKDLDLSSLRYFTNAAAPLPPAHIQRLRGLLPHVAFFSMYGQTECTRISYLDPAKVEAKTASVGQAVPNAEIYIVDEQGRRLGPGETGELVVRGSGVMRGYWRRPEDTARALRDGPIPGEKVLHTGDLFRMDEDGDLFFVGRSDDVFKCRGEKVSPREVENALHEMEDIAEAAVIGVPDPLDGMAVKAFVVAAEGRSPSEQEIRRHCAQRLEPHMTPKLIEFCDALPKTDSGKVTKAALRG